MSRRPNTATFLPGRRFTGPHDFNTQLQQWLTLVNARRRRALGCAPAERITADRQRMLALPPVAPATGWRAALRLPRGLLRQYFPKRTDLSVYGPQHLRAVEDELNRPRLVLADRTPAELFEALLTSD